MTGAPTPARGEYRHTVRESDLATAWDNDVPVLATPVLLWIAERAAMQISDPGLEPGRMTVGVAHESVQHLAATPVGWEVVATATTAAVRGTSLTVDVEIHDGVDVVYRGRHTRVVVDRDRFVNGVRAKAGRALRTRPPAPVGSVR